MFFKKEYRGNISSYDMMQMRNIMGVVNELRVASISEITTRLGKSYASVSRLTKELALQRRLRLKEYNGLIIAYLPETESEFEKLVSEKVFPIKGKPKNEIYKEILDEFVKNNVKAVRVETTCVKTITLYAMLTKEVKLQNQDTQIRVRLLGQATEPRIYLLKIDTNTSIEQTKSEVIKMSERFKLIEEQPPVGRMTYGIYDEMIKEFIEKNVKSVKIEFAEKKVETLSAGVFGAVKKAGLSEKVRVSQKGGSVFLIRKDM